MSNTSREYAKFKRNFIGPTLKRKQRIALLPPMPADPLPYQVIRAIKKDLPDVDDWRNVKHSINLKPYVTPAWANKDAIKEIYLEAQKLSKTTSVKHHVDHIIPLRHPLVCGLHVENNLQILTKDENIAKSNLFNV
jgi:hypothetical protein